MSPLRWTTKSTRHLAGELTRQGHRISAETVADLLREEGFSLQGNAKTIEGRQHPDRDGQFRYINERAKEHQAAGDPVVSVDTKKKEVVGNYKNAGGEWHREGEPVQVRTHDFPDPELGKAIPYGIYDLAANTGWVSVGTDHDTAAFAVESIRRWWNSQGRGAYPHSRRLLITADAGGSNGYRTRAWKAELAALALETGLAITVCHFPPGTSKWNKVEHRLFSHITMNWRGRPLTSHEVIVNSIAATATRTGLTVHAELDTTTYETAVRIGDRQMDALPLHRHEWHGDWNHTLRPEAYAQANDAPDPFDQPSPDLAWLCHPALTGMPAHEWDTLITTLTGLHEDQREAHLDKRRGHRPRLAAPGTGRRPMNPRRPAPGHPPPLPAWTPAGRHRPPLRRHPRNHQPAHPRHPPTPRHGRTHHPPRRPPTRHPGAPLRPHEHGRPHRPTQDQDSELIIRNPLRDVGWCQGVGRGDLVGVRCGAGQQSISLGYPAWPSRLAGRPSQAQFRSWPGTARLLHPSKATVRQRR